MSAPRPRPEHTVCLMGGFNVVNGRLRMDISILRSNPDRNLRRSRHAAPGIVSGLPGPRHIQIKHKRLVVRRFSDYRLGGVDGRHILAHQHLGLLRKNELPRTTTRKHETIHAPRLDNGPDVRPLVCSILCIPAIHKKILQTKHLCDPDRRHAERSVGICLNTIAEGDSNSLSPLHTQGVFAPPVLQRTAQSPQVLCRASLHEYRQKRFSVSPTKPTQSHPGW